MSPSHFLSQVGGRLFPLRLLFGLAACLAGFEWLSPRPFFGRGYRVTHALALSMIAGGLALRAWGAGSAGGHTRSGKIEGMRLATGGPFAYMRNPIYAGSVCLGIGMSWLIGDPVAWVLTGLVFALLYLAIIPAEEDFLLRQFGSEYRDYKVAVPRCIPRLRPWPGRTERAFGWQGVVGECYILLVLVLIYLTLLLEEHLDAVGVS